ncbi:helix-turn-helix domain-containing protein [Niameybacter massiliensis]|uniref:helix-turn-helix domain-containing protein n=1 Tax=Niameybacter massiliensis TaxID=1658108 RepID=UPI0006B694F0|nr:helix-turn-helix transcriptional regulator [Niameybacter massiliensis]
MISYIGLEEILREHSKDRKYLHDHVGLSWDTIAKFKKGESVNLSTVEKICLEFNCNIEDIVKIKRDPTN